MQLEESQSNGHPTTGRDKRSKGASAFHMQTGNSNSKTAVDSSNSTHLSSFKGKRKFVRKCPRCQEDHWLSGCSEFKALASEEHMRWIKEGHRCWKCARQHKQGQECDLRKTCMECNQLHLTVLHNLLTQPGYGVYYTQFNPNLSAFYGDGNPWHPREVSMKVVPIILYGHSTKLATYCLLDDAANFSMMLAEAADALNLKGRKMEMPIATARQECTPCKGAIMKFHIAPISDPSNKIPMSNVFSSEMLRLSEHTVPARNLQKRWTHLKDLPLHDCKNVRPLLLIGSDRPNLIVPIESHFGPEGAPVAVRTKLGWAVQGPTMNYRRRNEINLLCRQSQSESDAVLHENVHRLWRNDVQMYADRKQVGRSKQDQGAVDLLNSKSTYMMVEGVKRIATPLLWRCDEEMLSCPASSVLPALRRNERHLKKDPERAEVQPREDTRAQRGQPCPCSN